MSFIETVKAAGGAVLEAVKANPVVAGAAVVGTAVGIYGGYRGVKWYRARPAKGEAAPAAVAAETAVAAVPELTEEQITNNLLALTRKEAEDAGLFDQWAEALKNRLRAKNK